MTSTGTPRKTKKMIDRATIDAGIKMLKATPPKVETEFTQKATVEMATTVAADLFAKGYNAAEVRKMVIEALGLDLSPATVGSYLKGAPVETPPKSRSKKKSKGTVGKNEAKAETAPAPAEDAGQTAVQTPDASEHRPSADAAALPLEIAEASVDGAGQTAEPTPDVTDPALTEDAMDMQPETPDASPAADMTTVDTDTDADTEGLNRRLDEMMNADDDAPVADVTAERAGPVAGDPSHATSDAEDL